MYAFYLDCMPKQAVSKAAHPARDVAACLQGPILGVLGCMAERLKEKLLHKDKLADLVVGPDAYRDLPRLLAAVQVCIMDFSLLRQGLPWRPDDWRWLVVQSGARSKADAMNVQLSLEETYADIVPLRSAGTTAAFLSIMRGCNNMCTFCVVPFTRGRERSRPTHSILDEVSVLSMAICKAAWHGIHADGSGCWCR